MNHHHEGGTPTAPMIPARFAPGTRVLVASGPYAGLSGTIAAERPPWGGVMVDLGYQHPVNLDKSELEVVSG